MNHLQFGSDFRNKRDKGENGHFKYAHLHCPVNKSNIRNKLISKQAVTKSMQFLLGGGFVFLTEHIKGKEAAEKKKNIFVSIKIQKGKLNVGP